MLHTLTVSSLEGIFSMPCVASIFFVEGKMKPGRKMD